MSLLTRRSLAFLTPSGAITGSGHDETVVVRIYERIATRLGPRIRRLDVTADEGQIRLKGECSTYHTKQLAQHAALGVIEHESLENEIVVKPSSSIA